MLSDVFAEVGGVSIFGCGVEHPSVCVVAAAGGIILWTGRRLGTCFGSGFEVVWRGGKKIRFFLKIQQTSQNTRKQLLNCGFLKQQRVS